MVITFSLTARYILKFHKYVFLDRACFRSPSARQKHPTTKPVAPAATAISIALLHFQVFYSQDDLLHLAVPFRRTSTHRCLTGSGIVNQRNQPPSWIIVGVEAVVVAALVGPQGNARVPSMSMTSLKKLI